MKKRLIFIDNMRGIATLFVIMWHLGFGFWYMNNVVSSLLHIDERLGVVETVSKLWDDIINAVRAMDIDFGRLGVATFFLISGFVIPYSVETNRGANKILFLLKRILRIWPIYIIGTGITFSNLQLYGWISNGEWSLTLKDYLIQSSLLGDWFESWGFDGICWTLQIEIKFYIFFFLLCILRKESDCKAIAKFAVVIALLSILYSANTNGLLNLGRFAWVFCNTIINACMYILFFLMGTGLCCLYVGKWGRKEWLVVEEVLLICFIVSVHSLMPDYEKSVYLNYILAFLIFLNVYLLRDKITQGRILKFFAENSFCIFILHGVNGYILLTIFYDIGVPMYINLLVVIMIVLTVSWLLHRYVEKPIGQLTKKYIVGRFEK